MEIVSGAYLITLPIPDSPLGHLNSYLIKGKDGYLMIDTGWGSCDAFNALETQLSQLGISIEDIITILVTHVHPDHFGLFGRIKQASPRIRLLTHLWESKMIDSRYFESTDVIGDMGITLKRHGVPYSSLSALKMASMPPIDFVSMVYPDIVLYGGEILSTGIYDLEVIWTPGHSPGHICFYEPRNKLLFSGDHVLPSITANIGYHVQSGNNPLGDYLNSLRNLSSLRVEKTLPAHEQMFDDLRGRIREIFDHHDRRNNEIINTLAMNTQNAYEISSQISWDIDVPWEELPPLQMRASVMETVAHLEYLRWEGKVDRLIINSAFYYILS